MLHILILSRRVDAIYTVARHQPILRCFSLTIIIFRHTPTTAAAASPRFHYFKAQLSRFSQRTAFLFSFLIHDGGASFDSRACSLSCPLRRAFASSRLAICLRVVLPLRFRSYKFQNDVLANISAAFDDDIYAVLWRLYFIFSLSIYLLRAADI